MLEKTLDTEFSEISQRAKIARLLFQIRQLRLQNRVLLKKNSSLEKDLRQQKFQVKHLARNLMRINSEINEEMETAKKIQEGLMPTTLPEMINLDSAVVYIPASKVGGDLYDIMVTPSQKTAVLIFDVSGHGIPAALVGAMAKMLFAHFIEKTESPAEVFRLINKQICSFVKTEQYLTAFLGFIDPVKNIMTYSRAGHVPPLVYRKKEQKIISLDSRGFFIGHSALENLAEYWEQTINLEPGDKILFYTDGLTEGRNHSGALYGNERLRVVYSSCAGKNLNDVLENIVSDQTNFRNGMPLRDDFTLLCIEFGNTESLLEDSGFTREEQPDIRALNSYTEIEKTCDVILKEMDRKGFSDKSIKQFKFCIYEMITNALIHGNRGDPSRRVVIFYKVTLFAATISVLDEGQGFNYNDIPNPLLPENRLKDHGRGLFLIHHYMDEVSFNERGNRITGRKYCRGE